MRCARLVLLPLLLLIAWLSPGTARASPWALEDSLVDGDLDAEDIEVRTRQRSSPKAGGDLALSLIGLARDNEIGGVLVLALPFDRLARGSVNTTPTFLRTATQTSVAAGIATAEPFDLSLSPRLARSCVNAAWRAAGLSADDERLDGLVSRARWSALLPETRLRAIKYDSASLYSALDPLGTPTYYRDTTGGNLGLEARLTWRFDRIVYADDEPSIERIRMDQRDARSRVAAKALELLFHWQRATLDQRTLPPSQLGTRDEADVVLRIMEAEAALDVITNGWFTAHKPKRGVTSSL